jgi:hypothetical protein
MAFVQTKANINTYLESKKWPYYLPLLFLGIYIFIAVLGFDPNKQAKLIIMPAQSLDFALHEFAHIFTAFLPSLITAASGSLSELLLGAGLVFGAFKTRCYFASLICCLWFMLACQSAGIYMADARAERLNLVSLGGALSGTDKATHDWHFVFDKLHILSLDRLIGNTVRGFGIIVGLAGIIFAVGLMYAMATQTKKPLVNEDKKELHTLYPTATKGPLASITPDKDQSGPPPT